MKCNVTAHQICTEHTPEIALSPGVSQMDSKTALRTAYRKTDLRLVAWYTLVFLILRTEAHNITNAAIMNVEAGTDVQHQLGDLTSEQWALILSISHYPQLLFGPVAVLLLKVFTPKTFIGSIIIAWSIVSTCDGATQNFAGLLACRFLLGLIEAGSAPGVLYHLSFWYPAERLPLRLAFLYGVSQLSGSFSGLLAFAVSFLNGKGGLAGWRYLFILEGIPAILCGLCSFHVLPNYPEGAKFLTQAERSSVMENLPKSQPNSNDNTWDKQQIKTLFKGPTTYTFILIWTCHSIGGEGSQYCTTDSRLRPWPYRHDYIATNDHASIRDRSCWLNMYCVAHTTGKAEALDCGTLLGGRQ